MNSKFVRFGVVGAAGFPVDAGLLMLLTQWAGWNPFVARLASFVAAATATWWLNRRFTFLAGNLGVGQEWLRYMTAMALGGLVNYSVFAVLLLVLPLAMRQPWLGVALGSLAGLVVNYYTSSRFVFKSKTDATSRPPCS